MQTTEGFARRSSSFSTSIFLALADSSSWQDSETTLTSARPQCTPLTTSNARFDRLRAQEHCVAGYMLKDELDREIEKLISTSSDHWLVEEGEG